MKIAVDADDTFFDYWIGVVTAKVEGEFGVDLTWQPGSNWDSNPVKNFFKSRGEDWWDWMQRKSWLWALCKPFDGAIGCVEDWRRQGHTVELLTKKPDWAIWTVYNLLAKWKLSFDKVIAVPLDGAKHDYSDADLLIDDSDSNIQGWINTGRGAVLFERPWNKEADFEGGPGSGLIQNAQHWAEVRDLVNDYETKGQFVECV